MHIKRLKRIAEYSQKINAADGDLRALTSEEAQDLEDLIAERLESESKPWNLIVCGPWLGFSIWKRILLALRYWLPWVIAAAWRSKRVWWRYWLWKLFGFKPMVWADIIDGKPDKEDLQEAVLFPGVLFGTLLAGKGRWLWYESIEQLERKRDEIDYPVDWDSKGKGWYPFW